MNRFTVLDLLDMDLKDSDKLELSCKGGRKGLSNIISDPNINRPGLALAGFLEKFAAKRIQIFGRGESAYLKKLEQENKSDTLKVLFQQNVPCAVFTSGIEPGAMFRKLAEEACCPILCTSLDSSEFSVRINRILSLEFAPRQTVHGVFIEVFGIGVLIRGDSGVGKSEAALELVERGHRLVADDAVELKRIGGSTLSGCGTNRSLGHHMEIRGLGILNISHIFGVGAIRDKKQVQLIVYLEEWNNDKQYDRLGSADETKEILGIRIPFLIMPVKPGRNIPVLIETAAMNERLKKLGYNSARDFDENVLRWLESKNARNLYFSGKDVF